MISMGLITEQLLQPRYKVIAGYPEMEEHDIEVGQILEDTKERPLITATLDKYPHLFKPLSWHEDRDVSDMPEYVKYIGNESKGIMRVGEWGFCVFWECRNMETDERFMQDDVEPATLEEYNEYKTKHP